MQFEARRARQPALDDRMLMGGVIIQNDVNALAQRNFAVDLFEKFQPLAMGVFLGSVSDDFARQVIQRGKESDGAVARVIVGLSTDMSFAQRQTRLTALQRLDLALLVTTEHHCLLWRIEVKTDDIPKFRLKIRIAGKLKDTRQVWLDFVFAPDALNGCLGDTKLARHRAASPSYPTLRWACGLIDDLAQQFRADIAFAAPPALLLPPPPPPPTHPPPPFL